MARKKQEIQLLREIETQEEWEDIMAKEGLWGKCLCVFLNFNVEVCWQMYTSTEKGKKSYKAKVIIKSNFADSGFQL